MTSAESGFTAYGKINVGSRSEEFHGNILQAIIAKIADVFMTMQTMSKKMIGF